MRKAEKKKRIGLTLLIAALVFVIQIFAVLIAVGIVNILMQTGIIEEFSKDVLTPSGTLLLMSAISLLAGVVVAAFSGKFYLQPVNRFIDQMNRLAAGDFQARLHFGKPISSHPAFREIEGSFNKMAEELESTEMLRSDFINNFSHEFKTPIVSITGFAKLLKHGDLTPEQREEYLDIIERESLRLAAMATNILDMTKVENQTILTDVTRFNLSEQLRSCVLLLLEGKWKTKEIDFSIEFDEHMIIGNQELLKHVWINLLDNAIKFSPEGGTVDVTIREQADALAVTIANRGSEIPKEQLSKIFHKFYQADESHSTEGNGIGLALVKKITQLHKGNVTVSSENGVTVFTVALPKTHYDAIINRK